MSGKRVFPNARYITSRMTLLSPSSHYSIDAKRYERLGVLMTHSLRESS